MTRRYGILACHLPIVMTKPAVTVNVNAILRNFPDADLIMNKGVAAGMSAAQRTARRQILRRWRVDTGFSKASFQFNLLPKEGRRLAGLEIRNTASYALILENKDHIVEQEVNRIHKRNWGANFAPVIKNWRTEASASENEIRKYVKSRGITIRRGT